MDPTPQSAGTRLAHCQATTAAPRRVELRREGVEHERIHSPLHIPFDSPGHDFVAASLTCNELECSQAYL